MAAIGAVVATVGLVLVVVAIGMGYGIVPQPANVIAQSNGVSCNGTSMITGYFLVGVNTTTDVASYFANQAACSNVGLSGAKIIGQNVSWGDGASTTNVTIGKIMTHLYSPGTYTVTSKTAAYFLFCLFYLFGVCFQLPAVSVTSQTATITVPTPAPPGGSGGGGSGGGGAGGGSTPPPPVKSNASLTANYNVTLSRGNHLNVVDHSMSTGGATATQIQWNWGDGTYSFSTGIGSNASHTYSAKGNFTVLESVTWTAKGVIGSQLSTYSTVINVNCPSSSNASVCASGDALSTSPTSSSHPFVFTAYVGLLSFSGVALIAVVAIPATRSNPLAAIVGVLIAAGIGFGLGITGIL